MSEYARLKQEIESLDNGWDKKADDLLQKIIGAGRGTPVIEILGWSGYCSYGITVRQAGWHCTMEAKTFEYHSQCEKMSAFKKALLWLLDNSDIKKDAEIKVGDWVKIIISGYNTSPDDIGKITKVIAVGGKMLGEGAVTLDNSGLENKSTNWVGTQALKLATPEEVEEHLRKKEKITKITEIENKINELRKEVDKLREDL